MQNEDNIRLIEILSALNSLQANSEKIDNKLFQLDQLLQKTREEQIQKITELQIEARGLNEIKLSVQINTDKIDQLEDVVKENDLWIKGEIARREKRSDLLNQNVSSITVNGLTQLISLIILLLILGWTVFREEYLPQAPPPNKNKEEISDLNLPI